MTSNELKEAARGFGADLVGIAAVSSLEYLAKEDNPLSIFPQAANVIVLGRKIPRGTLRSMEQGTELDNTFKHFGFMDLEDNLLAKTTYDTVIWMESHGFEAVPLFGYDCTGQPVGVPVAEGKPAPNVILQYRLMAQAAGLGETGLNGLFLTPEFGPRQRFAMLLTDAELDADKPFVPHLCDDCGKCAELCPLHALDAEKSRKFGVKGFERNVAARRNDLCLRCKNGAVQTNEGRFNTVERIGAACGRACIAALEERGAAGEKFTTPFRKTEGNAWSSNLLGERA